MLLDLLMFPVRVLLIPFQALRNLNKRDERTRSFTQRVIRSSKASFQELGNINKRDERKKHLSVTQRVVRSGQSLFVLPFRLLRALVDSLVVLGRRKDVRFLMAALLLVGISAIVFFLMIKRGELIETRNLKGAQEALNSSPPDFELAKSFYQKLLSNKELTPPQNFEFTTILRETGEVERANQLVRDLAPDDRPGYGPAHLMRAISIAQQLEVAEDRIALPVLRRHLQNARDDDSPEIQQAWAIYYLAVEQFDDALAALDKAAQPNPKYYVLIAAYYKSQGRIPEYSLTLQKAATRFQTVLDQDDRNTPVRIALARVVANLGTYDRAERILMDGFRVQPDASIKRAIADLSIMRHDIARQENQDIDLQMRYLKNGLKFDRDYALTYSKLVAMFKGRNSPEVTTEIRAILQNIVDSENPTSYAHFALSSVLWQDGKQEQAQFHLEEACQMDENIVLALNNLAWLLAHADKPDLDRALELSKTAVDKRPTDNRLRGTLGTIYLKMGRDSEAVVELKKSLPAIVDKKEVHRKLALAYQNLNMSEMAKIHEEQAK